jgi:hypothetical protein
MRTALPGKIGPWCPSRTSGGQDAGVELTIVNVSVNP